MNTQIVPIERADDGALIVSSQTIAEGSDVQHKNVLESIARNQTDLQEFGQLAFETRPGYNNAAVRIALLNEQQATLVMTYQRNTEQVKAFKLHLVKSFFMMAKELAAQQVPRSLPEALRQFANEVESHEATKAVVAVLEPKAASWDSIVSSKGSWSYNDAAKVLCDEGAIQIGEKRLVRLLVDWGHLFRDHKGRPHVYQRFLEQGLYAAKARTYEDKHTGEVKESSAPQVRITGKGLDMIRTHLIEQMDAA